MDKTISVPLMSQPKGFSHCAVACIRMLMAYNGKLFTHDQLLKHFHEIDKTQVGITPTTAYFAVKEGFEVEYFTNQDLVDDSLKDKKQSSEDYKKLAGSLAPDSSKKKQWDQIIKFIEAGGKFFIKQLNTGDIDQFLKKGIPVRVGVKSSLLYSKPNDKGNHAVVVRGMRVNEYLINDPAPRFKEPYWIKKEKLSEAWRANGTNMIVVTKRRI